MNISDWRRKIDAIDTALLHLLNLRAEMAIEVGKVKDEQGLPLRVPVREQEILSRLKTLNPGPFDGQAIDDIYQVILREATRLQEAQRHGVSAEPKERKTTRRRNRRNRA
jgi:chorismate mutase